MTQEELQKLKDEFAKKSEKGEDLADIAEQLMCDPTEGTCDSCQ